MFKIAVFLALVALAQGGVIAPVVPVAHHAVVHPVPAVAAVHTAVVHPAPVVHPVVHAAPIVHPVVPVVKHAPIIAVHGVHHG